MRVVVVPSAAMGVVPGLWTGEAEQDVNLREAEVAQKTLGLWEVTEGAARVVRCFRCLEAEAEEARLRVREVVEERSAGR